MSKLSEMPEVVVSKLKISDGNADNDEMDFRLGKNYKQYDEISTH